MLRLFSLLCSHLRGFYVGSMFCGVTLSVFYSFVIISLRKRELVDSHYLCSCCRVAVIYVLCRFLTVPWVGQWSVIVAFPGHNTCFLK